MQSNMKTLSLHQRQILVVFFISFWVVGFALAFWEGLGWLMLFQALQSLTFTSPHLYLLIVRLLFGKDIEEKEKAHLKEKGNYRLISWQLAVRTVIAIGLTILFFWKINIPIIQFIKIIFG